jgi:hypothetical protein
MSIFIAVFPGTDEFTAWSRSQVQEIAGLDLASDEQPPTEVGFAWSAS